MGDVYRRSYSKVWFPSADSVGCPKDALLRGDNLILSIDSKLQAMLSYALNA